MGFIKKLIYATFVSKKVRDSITLDELRKIRKELTKKKTGQNK